MVYILSLSTKKFKEFIMGFKKERYGFIWYGDKEIFDATDEEIETTVRT